MNDTFSAQLPTVVADPFFGFLLQNWAEIGGWSLFISFCIFAVTGAVREWWVPGGRYKRLEEASLLMSAANDELTKQNGQLIQSNEIAKYFFEETVPKRGEPKK